MASPTRGAAIVFQLTHEILSGALAPGATLEEAALAARLGASRTPVREALRQLSASGLVELRPHRPARVMPVDEGRIRDVALHEGEPTLRQPVEGGAIARVGELVEHRHVMVGVRDHVVHEVGADEPGAAGDEKLHGLSLCARSPCSRKRKNSRHEVGP